jgi:two-component system, cell cycle sensor histidine kinase and response regulator CckA
MIRWPAMGNDTPGPGDPVVLAQRVAALEAELAALRTSHATFVALVESVPDFVVRITPEGVFEYVNRLAAGLTREQVLGRSIFDFTEPENHAVMRAALQQVLATGEPASYETTGTGAHGPSTPYFSRLAPIVEDGRVVALTQVATDIFELKEAARRLAAHRHRLELAAEAARIGYWHWDAGRDLVVWDATTCRHFGVPPEAGRTTYQGFLDRVHPADRDRIQSEVDQSVALGRYVGLQFRTVTPDGEVRWLMTSGRVERDDRGQPSGLLGCLLDVTERRRLEERLAQAQRLDAVGQLAAGVAHNFNNLLAALVPTLELTARRSPASAPLLGDLLGAAERAAEVVRQLTAFAGGAPRGTVRPASDAADLARRVAELTRNVLDRAIVVDVVTPEAPVLVEVDGGALEQALMNLVLNARDALTEVIAEGRPARIEIEVAARAGPEGRVELRVTDTGAGMTEEVRRRAIEPFFTTKPPGRGTGLGLSSVYAIVAACGGDLEIVSRLGGGTTIHLVVPAAVAPPAPAAPAPRARGGRGEVILLVDDDPTVRHAIGAVLEDEGYRVRGIGDPHEALEVFAADPDGFAVAIVDHSMPGLSGHALLGRMLAIAPRTRAISFSGHDVPLSGARAQLAKPVSLETLLATLRRVLDEP